MLNRTTVIIGLSFTMVYLLMARVYGGFDIGRRKSKPIIMSMGLNVLAADVAGHLFMCIMNYTVVHGRHFVYERPWLLLCVFVCQLVWITALTYLGNGIYFRVNEPQNCLLVARYRSEAEAYARNIGTYKKQYRICGYAELNDADLLEKIDQAEAVFFCDVTETERSPLVAYCYQQRKDVYYSIELTDIVAMGGRRVYFGDKTMIASTSKGLTFEERVIKRLCDIFIAAFGLLITSPILLATALAIKLEDGGPVFYRQPRATYAGRIFYVIKFRSMRVQDGTIHKSVTKDDDRITKTGRFIRKYRIDELPQLINILRGDMSLVGPRPERPELTEKYSEKYPEFRYRLQVKAGLTGYAQVIGTYDTEPLDKLKMDLMYIEQYSFLLDIQILMMTVKTAFFPPETNAEELKILQNPIEQEKNTTQNEKENDHAN